MHSILDYLNYRKIQVKQALRWEVWWDVNVVGCGLSRPKWTKVRGWVCKGDWRVKNHFK